MIENYHVHPFYNQTTRKWEVNQQGVDLNYKLRGAIEMALDDSGIDNCEWVAPQTWKKKIAGNGEATKNVVKQQIEDLARLSFPMEIFASGKWSKAKKTIEDASDATAIALYAVQKRFGKLSFVDPTRLRLSGPGAGGIKLRAGTPLGVPDRGGGSSSALPETSAILSGTMEPTSPSAHPRVEQADEAPSSRGRLPKPRQRFGDNGELDGPASAWSTAKEVVEATTAGGTASGSSALREPIATPMAAAATAPQSSDTLPFFSPETVRPDGWACRLAHGCTKAHGHAGLCTPAEPSPRKRGRGAVEMLGMSPARKRQAVAESSDAFV